jgi:uncharacterized membrane protein YgcG
MKKYCSNGFYVAMISIFLISGCQQNNEEPGKKLQIYNYKDLVKEFNLETVAPKNNVISFNSTLEAKYFLLSVSKNEYKANLNFNKTALSSNPNQRVEENPSFVQQIPIRAKIATINGQYAYMNITINIKYTLDASGNVIDVPEIYSSLSGLTLGFSLEQKMWIATKTGKTNISFEIHAVEKYNILVEGIGTVYSKAVVLEGTLDVKENQATLDIRPDDSSTPQTPAGQKAPPSGYQGSGSSGGSSGGGGGGSAGGTPTQGSSSGYGVINLPTPTPAASSGGSGSGTASGGSGSGGSGGGTKGTGKPQPKQPPVTAGKKIKE